MRRVPIVGKMQPLDFQPLESAPRQGRWYRGVPESRFSDRQKVSGLEN